MDMTQDHLYKAISEIVDLVIKDPRWIIESDDLGVSVLGMLLYGYSLAVGRMVMMLDIEDIDAVLRRCMVERVGAASKWVSGLVSEANKSAFDEAYHPGQYELIGVGHQYFGVSDHAMIVDNIFANIQAMRRASN